MILHHTKYSENIRGLHLSSFFSPDGQLGLDLLKNDHAIARDETGEC